MYSKFRGTKELPHLDSNKTSYYFLCSLRRNYVSIKLLQLYEVLLILLIARNSTSSLLQRLVSLVGKYTEDVIRNLCLLESLDSSSSNIHAFMQMLITYNSGHLTEIPSHVLYTKVILWNP